jgi:hypothetical protein
VAANRNYVEISCGLVAALIWKGYLMRVSVFNSRFQPLSSAQLQQVAGGSNNCCLKSVEAAVEAATCNNPCVVAAVNQVNCCISQVQQALNCL